MPKRRTQAEKSGISEKRVLDAALALFSRQGFRATSMRQIAKRSKLSVGNLYHHFGSKEKIFQLLLDQYWQVLLDPELPLNKVFAAARFPDDLEEMAAAIESVVAGNARHILLIYIDVIEFKGSHIRAFYQRMADRFAAAYQDRIGELRGEGRVGEADPLAGVMMATRWFFYFFTVEKCFGVPMHLGLSTRQAVEEFSKIIRYGVLPRSEAGLPAAADAGLPATTGAAPEAARGGRP